MRAVTFVQAGTIGIRKYKPGDSTVLPEAWVRALLRRGLVIEGSSAPVAVLREEPEPVPEPVEERKTVQSLSRRALKRLLKRKA